MRLLELPCCLEEAARRKQLVLLVMLLARQEHRHWLRVWWLGRAWSEEVHQRRRQVQVQPRWLLLVVRVLRWRRPQQARLLVLRWWLVVDLHRRQVRQRALRPGVREAPRTRQRWSQVRLRVLQMLHRPRVR